MRTHVRQQRFKKQEKLARMFGALSHPARLRIIEILAARKSCICGEIVELMPLSQSTVSQHLKELRDAGIIKGRIDGIRTCYCLDMRGLRKYKDAMYAFIESLPTNVIDECCE